MAMKFDYELDQKENKAFELVVTIDQKSLQEEFENLVKEIAEKEKIKGFRQGKAPAKLVEEKIGKEKIQNQLLETVIRKVYPEVVKKADLKPVVPPKVELVSVEKNKDWKIKFTSAELPEIDLNDVKEKIKELNATSKIWTPDAKEKDAHEKKDRDKQIQKIIEKIVETVKLDLPKIILEEELNRQLVDLVDRTKQAGMDISQYLETKNMTIDDLKKNLRAEITNNWKIDLSLEKISDEENIEVTEKDTKDIEKSKVNPYLAAKIIRRQKTLEHLLNL